MSDETQLLVANARNLYREIDAHLDVRAKKPCAVFDLDGVLSDYPAYWVWFANDILGTHFSSLDGLRSGIPVERYKALKERFRASGVRKWMPVKLGAKTVFDKLKQAGFLVCVMTARKKTPSIEEDTLDWFGKNGLMPDEIVWDNDKVSAMRFHYPKARFFVEDELRNALPLAEAGFKVYFTGAGKVSHGNIVQITTLGQILEKEGL
jgi:hypothetical protein